MKEYKIIIDTTDDGDCIDYSDTLYAGDLRRSLSETFDWNGVHDRGVFTFNWMFKICTF